MKKILFLIIVLLCGSTALHAQEPKSSEISKPLIGSFERPRKPEKEPETADEFVAAARWVSWSERKPEAAIALLDKALDLDPQNINGYYLRGLTKLENGKAKEAISDFDNAIRLAPEYITAYQLRGDCKAILKDYTGALANMDMSVSILASKKQVQYSAFEKRGKVKYMLGNYDGAIEDFNNALLTGRGSGAFFLRTLTNIRKGDAVSALRDLNYLAALYEKTQRNLS